MNLAFSPDGRWFVTAGPDVNLRLWNMTHGTPSPDPDFSCRQQDPVRGLALTANSREVATGSHGLTARVWELADENPCDHPLAIPAGSVVNDVAISRDGNWLATTSWEPVYQGQLWHLMDAGRAEQSAVLQFKDRVFSVAFSSDTHWMAAGAWDGGVQVLDLTDPAKHSFRLPGHQGRVFLVLFNPDGRLLASLSEDHTIRLWDPARPVARPGILRDSNGFDSMVFSPDGRWLATASNDGAVKLWRLQLDDLIELACSLAGRNLSELEWRTFLGASPYSKTCPDLTRP
jgi:WD40 repeat protein